MKNESNLIPEHIGIIVDGNRRWAKKQNLPSLEGHRVGANRIKEIAEYALTRGVKILTIFVFSTENWKRSQEEVGYLFKLFTDFLNNEAENLSKRGIKLQILGDRSKFDDHFMRVIDNAEKITTEADKGLLNLCLNYGGRDEIVKAVQKIVANKVAESDITEDLIKQNLYSKNIMDPDFIIRTSGEQRLSGFLTWQSVYSELYFAQKMWPEFSKDDFDLALAEYSNRQRRFGGN
ncbi:MAG: undecaprenyl diphosphate synthase [Patescibacteria group bacterium]|nr:undecaprenyl diphosphate synthase [Patescibacteria group bacterium]MDQ5970847.1 undecaprenyl diphosphate synthase [Patescibacteria group bacterium]